MGFKLYFTKRKIEKEYTLDIFYFNSKSLDLIMKIVFPLIPIMKFMTQIEKNIIFWSVIQALCSFFLWDWLIKTKRNQFFKRIFLQIIVLIECLLIPEPLNFTFISLLLIIYFTFSTWHINFCFLSIHWAMYYVAHKFLGGGEINHFGEIIIQKIWVQYLIVFLFDIKMRFVWMKYYEEKRMVLTNNEIITKCNFFYFVIDQNLKFLEKSPFAQVFIKNIDSLLQKNKKVYNSFLSILDEHDRDRFVKQVLESKFPSDDHVATDYLIPIPQKILQDFNSSIVNSEEKMKNYFNTLILEKPQETNINKLGSEVKFSNTTFSNSEEGLFEINVSPIRFANKMGYLVFLKNEYKSYRFITKMKYLLEHSHEKTQDTLTNLEQEYIKWNNLQALSTVIESDMKNLALLIQKINFQLAEIYVFYQILENLITSANNQKRIEKNFNVINLFNYVIELVYLNATQLNYEVHLIVEDSFPDYVSGQFFLFKYLLLLLLNLLINEFEFPKNSKFKINCKLKEYFSRGNENHFGLRFEFEYANNIKFTSYLEKILDSKELTEPFEFLVSNKIACEKNLLIFLQKLLVNLNATLKIKENSEKSPIHSFFLETHFKTVELSTILSSPSRSLTNITLSRNKNKQFLPNLNLTFSKTLFKKNHHIWKNKPAPVAKHINSALLKSQQRNVELNEIINRKISIKNKDEPPISHQQKLVLPPEHEKKKSVVKELIGFEENTNFSWSETKKPSESETREKKNEKATKSILGLHSKAKSSDFAVKFLESPTIKVSHKSHFSCLDGNFTKNEDQDILLPSEFQDKFEKIVQENKEKIRKLFKQNLLSLLKEKPSKEEEETNPKEEIQKKETIKDKEFRRRRLKNKTCIHSEADIKNEKEHKKVGGNSATLINSPLFNKRNFISPAKHLHNSNSKAVSKIQKATSIEVNSQEKSVEYYENVKNEENLFEIINPFCLNEIPEKKLPFFLEVRAIPQKRVWTNKPKSVVSPELIKISAYNIQKSEKFYALLVDDNINNLKEYQKLSYNTKMLIDFSDSCTKAFEIFMTTLTRGKYYDLILINIVENLESEINKFIEQIRFLESQNKLENVAIFAVISYRQPLERENLLKVGANKIFYEEISEDSLKNIFNQAPRTFLLTNN